MEKLLTLYITLLDIYTKQVQKLEAAKNELGKDHKLEWIPYLALNHRMFTYDEYLRNEFYGGFCYVEKNEIMPYLIPFLVAFEQSSNEAKIQFEEAKPKNEYQSYLDDLLSNKYPIEALLKSQLHELQELQFSYDIPIRPQRSNATRQLAKYRDDNKKYFEKIEIIDRCRAEVNERLKLVNQLKIQNYH